MIKCAMCNQEFRVITNSHLLRKHGITVEEYVRQYGGHLLSEETRSKKSLDYGVNWKIVGLGTKPDSIISKEVGINRRTITYVRNKLGIPAFKGVILTQEGKPCRSIYEAMYDAYLHWQSIEHQHEVRVGDLPYIADFKVGQQFVEIAGMRNFAKYERKLKLKREAYELAGVPVKWLSPEDIEELYASCPVEVKFREKRYCERCGKQTHDLVKNVCRKCYMHVWREEKSNEVAICQQCGHEFTRPAGSPDQKFCSHECYASSIEFDWPSWEWIVEQLKTTSVRQLAFRIGIKPTTMYMHLRRRKQRNRGDLV